MYLYIFFRIFSIQKANRKYELSDSFELGLHLRMRKKKQYACQNIETVAHITGLPASKIKQS
jgi:hypothetical protein